MIDSACNRYEYQGYVVGSKGGRCVGLTNLPPFGNLEACPGLQACTGLVFLLNTFLTLFIRKSIADVYAFV